MIRSVKSGQRSVRILAIRIEGSTGTPSIEGIDKHKFSIVDDGVGEYTVTLLEPFAEACHATANAEAVDKAITLTTTASTVVIKVNDIDETAALSDGDLQLLVIGCDVTARY